MHTPALRVANHAPPILLHSVSAASMHGLNQVHTVITDKTYRSSVNAPGMVLSNNGFESRSWSDVIEGFIDLPFNVITFLA